jgi:hypothetical protein
LVGYFDIFLQSMPAYLSEKTRVNKVKQLAGFLFKGNDWLLAKRQEILKAAHQEVRAFIDYVLPYLKEGWSLG